MDRQTIFDYAVLAELLAVLGGLIVGAAGLVWWFI